jgi:hypothetical protein
VAVGAGPGVASPAPVLLPVLLDVDVCISLAHCSGAPSHPLSICIDQVHVYASSSVGTLSIAQD